MSRKTRWLILPALLLTLSNASFSQSLVRSTLSSIGSSYSEDGILVRQTVGQPSATIAFTNGTLRLNQGFQQPIIRQAILEAKNPIDLEIYPNPSKGKSLLRINEEISSYTITIYSAQGKILKILPDQSLPAKWLDFEQYMPGSYIVVVTTRERIGSKTLMLIKN